MTQEILMAAIGKAYERITGRPCAVAIFCVRRGSLLGYYMVHPIPSGDFYCVHVRRL